MTGREFERLTVKKLAESGYWALKIPQNEHGAQPFDIVAVKGNNMLAIDCKVCQTLRFPMARVEDNQWCAFASVRERTNAVIGLFVWFNNKVWFVSYESLLKNADKASIVIEDFLDVTETFGFDEV